MEPGHLVQGNDGDRKGEGEKGVLRAGEPSSGSFWKKESKFYDAF